MTAAVGAQLGAGPLTDDPGFVLPDVPGGEPEGKIELAAAPAEPAGVAAGVGAQAAARSAMQTNATSGTAGRLPAT